MKTILGFIQNIKQRNHALLIVLSVFIIFSCKKEGTPTDLGGEVDIPLAEVGNKTDVYVRIGDFRLTIALSSIGWCPHQPKQNSLRKIMEIMVFMSLNC